MDNYREEVGAIIFTINKEFLLVHAKSYAPGAFSWPKGGVENGESINEAINREIKEELGTNVLYDIVQESQIELTTLWPKEIQEKDGRLGSKQKLFYVIVNKDTIEINKDEIDEIKWVDKERILVNIMNKFPKQAPDLIKEFNSIID